MRLWTVHPEYLDSRGLCAAWREGLLAQAVLRGRTRGYRHHSQLVRFRATASPRRYIAEYLWAIYREAIRRGYAFDRSKLPRPGPPLPRMRETRGQFAYEWRHLQAKLFRRDRARWARQRRLARPRAHPLFRLMAGPVQKWERAPGNTPGDTSLRVSRPAKPRAVSAVRPRRRVVARARACADTASRRR